MKILLASVLLLAFAAGGFVAGSFRFQPGATSEPAGEKRRILYYVDPMNPTHISDQPGLAPCGMKLEPVYADDGSASPAGHDLAALAPGSVRISPERQQLAGIEISPVEKQVRPYSLRLPGRVVADETRVYTIKAAIGGYIGRTFPHSTGRLVQKDEVLAELNSPELLPALQSLLFALDSRRQTEDAADPGLAVTDSVFELDLSYQQSLEALRHMGMGQGQLDEVIRTRQLVKSIAITSPATGLLTRRHVSDELHVAMGEELFQVADLSRIWIHADISGWESEYLKPGSDVRVLASSPAKIFTARVSQALPLYADDLHTLQVRLELDNPDYALRPGMFVDVEYSLTLPEMILINADALLDTGRRQTVFLDRGHGYFEPREVKAGRHLGDLVEIRQGLVPGDQIVVSGNFLIDSESRIKLAAAARRPTSAIDPVCGMKVEPSKARKAGRCSAHQGQNYFFCNDGCKRAFDANPGRVLNEAARTTAGGADLPITNETLGHHP